MSGAWALRVDGPPARLVARLGPLRLASGVAACVDGDPAAGALARGDEVVVWLRGEALDPDLDRRLRATGGQRFEVAPDGALRPPGRRLPVGRLPAGPWRPLAALLAPAEAVARDAAPGARAPLRLVRDPAAPEAPTALLVAAEALAAWAATASQARLVRLEVARRADAPEALVRGRPLPPLPGARLVVRGGVAVPAGLALAPALDPAALAALFDLAPGDLALVSGDVGDAAAVERVAHAAFAPLTRSLARSVS
ncbi:MAG: hypothetical protein M9894_05245 [Planctomycetes bacterium]|nr:hypothetical protein [Planctomycetota bacterium]